MTNPYSSPAPGALPRAQKYASQNERLRYRATAVAISVPQLFICTLFAFGDIGFDHPGRFGLDFGHVLLLLAVQAGLILTSIVLPIVWRRWRLLLIPATFVPLTLLAVWYGS